ncbi:hypothetical protein Syun_004040 [Stephania yunnanensis]|uniref:Uncharacterized protein n=1 Tax=Stephania yunnanensis TaxID=152371 RepID=A0AAP0L296_9MAGN
MLTVNREWMYYRLGNEFIRRQDMKTTMPIRPKRRWCGVQRLMQLFKGSHSSRLLCRASWNTYGLWSKHLSGSTAATTTAATTPPPPQEHHQQVGIDSTRSPHQQHDDDDKDNHDWLEKEYLGDES